MKRTQDSYPFGQGGVGELFEGFIKKQREKFVSFFRKVMDETYYKFLNFGFSLVLLAAGTGTGKSVSTISNE